MLDLERIEIIISDIEMYLVKLESFKIKSVNDLNDDKNLYSTSMVLFNVLNRMLDLAEQIVKDKSLGFPTEYKDLFIMLNKSKIISNSLKNKLIDLVRFRNKISHRYGKLKNNDIFIATKEVKILKDFIKEIEKEAKKK